MSSLISRKPAIAAIAIAMLAVTHTRAEPARQATTPAPAQTAKQCAEGFKRSHVSGTGWTCSARPVCGDGTYEDPWLMTILALNAPLSKVLYGTADYPEGSFTLRFTCDRAPAPGEKIEKSETKSVSLCPKGFKIRTEPIIFTCWAAAPVACPTHMQEIIFDETEGVFRYRCGIPDLSDKVDAKQVRAPATFDLETCPTCGEKVKDGSTEVSMPAVKPLKLEKQQPAPVPGR